MDGTGRPIKNQVYKNIQPEKIIISNPVEFCPSCTYKNDRYQDQSNVFTINIYNGRAKRVCGHHCDSRNTRNSSNEKKNQWP